MGGKGSGGARVGAGRKSKTQAQKWLGGNAGKRGSRAKPKPAAIALIAAPPNLSADQVAAWNELAPHACAERTLVAGTVAAFRDLCEAIVVKRELLEQIQKDGYTYLKVTIDGAGQEHQEVKAHPLLAQHRGMMQRVEAGMLRFRLSPIGKELLPPEKPKDEWDDLDATVN